MRINQKQIYCLDANERHVKFKLRVTRQNCLCAIDIQNDVDASSYNA